MIGSSNQSNLFYFAISSVHSITIHKFALRLAGQTGDNFAFMSAHYLGKIMPNPVGFAMMRRCL